jgi:hypothetical protein
MAEPGTQSVAGIVLGVSDLGRGTKRVRDALGRTLVIGGEGDTHMAVVENGIVRPIGFLDLIERLSDEELFKP